MGNFIVNEANGRTYKEICVCMCVSECFNINVKVTLINSSYSSLNMMGNDDAFMAIWLVLHFTCNALSLWLFLKRMR